MLAQIFKTADELKISDHEHVALIRVLGMLERGELVDVDCFYESFIENGFNMGTVGDGCGTPACIGGWAALLMDVDQNRYLQRYSWDNRAKNLALYDLFWNEMACDMPAGVERAAIALRSYLTIGDARWDLALS